MQDAARRNEGHLLGYRGLEEELQIDRLAVEGEAPAWLAGSLLRTGPAKWDLGQQRVAHWFDGLAMRHRFSFAGGEDAPDPTANSLVKLDLHTGESRLWADRDSYPGEPVFVADPAGSDEDAGVSLSVVLDAASEGSDLLVLDAQAMQGRARALVPHHVPFGIHGEFYADDQA